MGDRFLQPFIRLLCSVSPLIWLGSGSLPAPDRKPCEIQGAGAISPLRGDFVETSGVVTLDFDETWVEGFFLQAPDCDGNAATSDGLFIYIGQQLNIVSPGDEVRLAGWVNEYDGLTELSVLPQNIERVGSQPLPAAVLFSPPWAAGPAGAYFEAHEAMRIRMPDAVVVGPTSSLETTYVVDAVHGIGRVFSGQPGGAIVTLGARGPFAVDPEVRVGDHIQMIEGVLDAESGAYLVHLTAAPAVVPGSPAPWNPPEREGDFTFASLNLHNLFDTFDDPLTADPVLTAGEYQTRLEKLARTIAGELQIPAFIAVQEAENGAVLQALANRPEIPIQYGYVWFDGPDVRGIDVALLYRQDQAAVLSSASRQGCTALVDGLGPDGNLNVADPQNALTCDLDGQPGFDGNRLFSRPPLVVRLLVCEVGCPPGGERREIWAIVVHFKSKSQDTSSVPYTLPRRLEQALFVSGLVQEILAGDPQAQIAVLGDVNDTPDSPPAQALRAAGLLDLMDGLPAAERYSYNFRGVSQVLDHVFVTPRLAGSVFAMLFARTVPINSDYPAGLESDPTTALRSSDHDPVLVGVQAFDRVLYFPAIWSDQ